TSDRRMPAINPHTMATRIQPRVFAMAFMLCPLHSLLGHHGGRETPPATWHQSLNTSCALLRARVSPLNLGVLRAAVRRSLGRQLYFRLWSCETAARATSSNDLATLRGRWN